MSAEFESIDQSCSVTLSSVGKSSTCQKSFWYLDFVQVFVGIAFLKMRIASFFLIVKVT